MPRLAFVLLCLTLAPPSLASSPRRPPLAKVLRGEALESYETARQDFKSQKFQQALAGFVRAHALSREPRLLWNQAACLRKLERNAEALRSLEAYLAQGAEELATEELDEAKRSLLAVRALVAAVQITTVPDGASISVDGATIELPAGQSLYVEPGRHAFLFAKNGYQQTVRQEVLRAGETVGWTVELVAAPSAAVVATSRPVAPAALSQPPPTVKRPWTPFLVVGGGAAAGAIGGVLLFTADADYTRLRGACGTMCSPQNVGPSRSKETAGLVLVAAGGAALAAGLGWWLLSGTEVRAQVAVSPGGVALEGRF